MNHKNVRVTPKFLEVGMADYAFVIKHVASSQIRHLI